MKIHRMRGVWSDKGQFYHVWDVLYAIMDHRGLAPGIWLKVYGNQTYRAGDSSWVNFPEKRIARSDLIKINGIGVLLYNKMAHKNHNRGIPFLSE